MRRWVLVATAVALVAVACGGSDTTATDAGDATDAPTATEATTATDTTSSTATDAGDDTTAGAATGSGIGSGTIGPGGGVVFTSDGIAALEVPPGALDGDTEISITAISAADFPEGLSTIDGVLGYDLQPDGLTFAEPATLTFVVAVGDQVPIPVLFSQDAPGDPLIPLAMTDVVVSGGIVSISGAIEHFSRFYPTPMGAVVIDPRRVLLAPGGPAEPFELTVDPAEIEEFISAEVVDRVPFVASEVSREVGDDRLRFSARVACTEETDGTVEAAYGYRFEFNSRRVLSEKDARDEAKDARAISQHLFGGLNIFDLQGSPYGVNFGVTGDATCPGTSGTASTGTGADDPAGTPAPNDGSIGTVFDDRGDIESDSTGAQPANRDIDSLSHNVFNGNHSITVVYAGELQAGDFGDTTVRVTFPGQEPIEWFVFWEMMELGSSESSTSGPEGPTPIMGAGSDGFFANFAEFPDGLPSGTKVEVTSCDENGAVCDSVEYTVP